MKDITDFSVTGTIASCRVNCARKQALGYCTADSCSTCNIGREIISMESGLSEFERFQIRTLTESRLLQNCQPVTIQLARPTRRHGAVRCVCGIFSIVIVLCISRLFL